MRGAGSDGTDEHRDAGLRADPDDDVDPDPELDGYVDDDEWLLREVPPHHGD